MTVNAEGKVVKVKVVQDYDGKSGVFYLIVCLHWMKLDVLAIKFDYIPFTCCISGRSLTCKRYVTKFNNQKIRF